jgi:hypothetical protein
MKCYKFGLIYALQRGGNNNFITTGNYSAWIKPLRYFFWNNGRKESSQRNGAPTSLYLVITSKGPLTSPQSLQMV